ncbi:MAG: hypothetical protein M1836_006014 [Candelina mexicana]|nr:MAG: hypothetical protein M1836_006014 [Candelina mexicana]
MLFEISVHSLVLLSLTLPLLSSALPRANPDTPANPVLQLNPPPLTFNPVFQPVVNPSFEGSKDIKQITPWSTAGSVQLNQQASNARTGSNSLLFDTSLASHTLSVQQTISVLPGMQYTLKFASRLIAPGVGASFCGLDTCINNDCTWNAGQGDAGVGGNAVSLTNDWQVVSRTWTAPGQKVKIELPKGGSGGALPALATGSVADFEKKLEGEMVKVVLAINGNLNCFAKVLIDDVTLELVKGQVAGMPATPAS